MIILRFVDKTLLTNSSKVKMNRNKRLATDDSLVWLYFYYWATTTTQFVDITINLLQDWLETEMTQLKT